MLPLLYQEINFVNGRYKKTRSEYEGLSFYYKDTLFQYKSRPTYLSTHIPLHGY